MKRIVLLMLACLIFGQFGLQPALAVSTNEETVQSATFLLKGSLRPTRDGRHVKTLLALRNLKDPKLAPLYSMLTQSENPVLKIHGVLGLAELTDDGMIDLIQIQSIEATVVQERLIAAVMDAGMLSDEDALQLVEWNDLDKGIKVAVCEQLIQNGKFDHMAILDEAEKIAIEDKHVELQGVINLYRLHLGDQNAMTFLSSLNSRTDPKNDILRAVLLTRALEMGTKAIGPWAMQIAQTPGVSRDLQLVALKTAIRFNAAGSQQYWLELFNSTTDLAQHMRLGLLAAREAENMEPELFDVMLNSESSQLVALGKAGKAIASDTNIVEEIVAILEMDSPHPLLIDWILRYTETQAKPDHAKAIFLAVILNLEDSDRYKARMLEDAMLATMKLQNMFPDETPALLGSIVTDPNAKPRIVKAILYGLLNSVEGNPAKVFDGYTPPKTDMVTRNFLWLLRAKYGQTLDGERLDDVSQMVRGGGNINLGLRVQGAWLYLQATGQTDPVLNKVLEDY